MIEGTDDTTPAAAPAATAPPGEDSLRPLMQHVEAAVRKLPAGDLAALRRLDPEAPATGAFWTLATTVLNTTLPAGGDALREQERRWAIVLHCMAHAQGQGRLGNAPPLGAAMARAEVHQDRVERWMRATGESFWATTRQILAHLLSRGGRLDSLGLAELVLSERDSAKGEAIRRRVFRAFHATTQGKKK